MSISPLNSELRRHALAARGFMPEDEGDALYAAAMQAAAFCGQVRTFGVNRR